MRIVLHFLVLSSVALLSSAFVMSDDGVNQMKVIEEENLGRVSKKIHYFPADGKKKPYSYVNKFGELQGFDVDLVYEVCKIAGKKCDTIIQPFTECLFTDREMDYGGAGLMSRHFDGCPGYMITTDRLNNFDFTLPYLTSECHFVVTPGNPKKFDVDASDYSKFKLLHLTAAPTNSHCLKRLSKKFGVILVANDLPEAKEMLFNGTADALFGPRTVIDGLEVLPQELHCSDQGAGILLQRDSTVKDWWNPAFQKFYFSGQFTELCKTAAAKYGRAPRCIPHPDEASPELLKLMSTKFEAKRRPHLYKFVVSGRIAPYSYLNKEGELVGFTRNMLEEVCKRAGKRCTLMQAQVPECSKRQGELLYPGRGLLENWFDGCTGYFNTLDRRNSYDFTSPYLVSAASFKVAPGNPKNFDPKSDDYSAFTIVNMATAITNDHCLNRLHKKFKKLIVVEDEIEAQRMILNGTADTWFTKFFGPIKLETLPGKFHCENVGTSIMVKKGSDVPGWWNPAFAEFYESGSFTEFCLEQGKKYNNKFPCLPAIVKELDEPHF